MVVLDLWSEIRPVWILTSAFYGKPFVWNLLHNFGGRRFALSFSSARFAS
jgi:alpha-N-acetylglucosaminidase